MDTNRESGVREDLTISKGHDCVLKGKAHIYSNKALFPQ